MLKNRIAPFLEKISGWFLLIFVFFLPIKMCTPYTYNIQQTVPLNILELFHFPWPAEWGLFIIIISLIIKVGVAFTRKDNILITDQKIILIIFLLLNYLAVFIQGVEKGGLQTLLLFNGYVIIYFLISSFKNIQGFKNILFLILIISFAYCVFQGLYQFLEGFRQTLQVAEEYGITEIANPLVKRRILGGKVFSTFIYSNSFAAYLILLISISMSYLKEKALIKKYIAAVLTGFIFFLIYLFILDKFSYFFSYLLSFLFFPLYQFYVLILTRSQGAWISLVLSALLSFLFLYKPAKKKLLLLLFLMLIITPIGLYNLKKVYPSFRVRSEYNQATIKMIADAPFIGHSPGRYGLKYMQYKLERAEEVQLAHNSPLQVAAESGIPSAILYIIFIVISLMGLKDNIFLFTGFLALNIHNFIDFNLYVPSLGYLIFLIAALANNNKTRFKVERYFPKIIIYISIVFLSLVITFMMIKINRSQKIYEIAHRYKEERNDYIKASELYLSSAMIYPWQQASWFNAAECLALSGRFEQAEDTLQKALKNEPEHAINWLHMARITAAHDFNKFRKIERLDKIKEYFDKSIEFYPENKKIIDEKAKFLEWVSKLNKS